MNLNGQLHDVDPQANLIITRAWKDKFFRQELLQNPKSVLERELGRKLPDELEIKILEDSPETRHLVLPVLPYYSGEPLDEALGEISIWALQSEGGCPTAGSTAITSACDCGAEGEPEPEPPSEPETKLL